MLPVAGLIRLDLIAALFYAARYLYFSPNAVGLSAALLVLLLLKLSREYVLAVGPGAWLPALALHLIGWFAQVAIGHAIYEKRAPALLENLQQVHKRQL